MRVPQLCIILGVMVVASATCIWANDDDSSLMTYAKYRIESSKFEKGSFETLPKEVWRSGTCCVRMEEQPDSAMGLHVFAVINEPDVWMVNRMSASGMHVVDPGPTFDAHCPISSFGDTGFVAELELGHELDFFKKHGEIIDDAGDHSDSAALIRYAAPVDNPFLFLTVRADNIPQSMLYVTEGDSIKIVYDVYQVDLPMDSMLFTKPEGIEFREAQ